MPCEGIRVKCDIGRGGRTRLFDSSQRDNCRLVGITGQPVLVLCPWVELVFGGRRYSLIAWSTPDYKVCSNSVIGEGMPLIYNGQEAGYNHRLKFFEKDPIVWKPSAEGDLYQKLFALKSANTALWNAHWGARMIPVVNNAPSQVLSFVRKNDKDKIFAVINLSGQPQSVTFQDRLYHGHYTEYFSRQVTDLDASTRLELRPWSYMVFVQ